VIFPQQERFNAQASHIISIHQQTEAAIRPHFHVTGPSGSGKSFLIKKICEELKMPFLEINAAGLTSEGISGNSLSKGLRKLREYWNEPNVIFVDEFDKLFVRNGETTEGFRHAVQDEFLMALESKYTSVFTDYGKYEPVKIDNSLFIFAGAYSNQKIEDIMALKDAGLRTEFVGRVPLVLYTEEVPLHELKKHIEKLDLWKSYIKLFPQTPKQSAIRWIVNRMQEQSRETPIGIRLMNSTIHQYFMKDI
jgi:ATP-dependent protease Clp ATPase subunit